MYLINVHGDDSDDGNGENADLSKKCLEVLTSLSNWTPRIKSHHLSYTLRSAMAQILPEERCSENAMTVPQMAS